MKQSANEMLNAVGIYRDAPPNSHEFAGRFPDGARYRIEIPSVEGPRSLEAVLAAARRWEVPVTRVSQGSGSSMLTDTEILEMVDMASESGVEISLFVRPNAGWDISAASRAPSGGAFAASTWGAGQLTFAVNELSRVAELGVRSVLIGDVGLLMVLGRLRTAGILPATFQAKTSVMLPACNTAAALLYAELGANTINVAPDLGVIDLAALRSAVTVPLDVYIEAPDDLGGFVRYHDLVEIVRVAAPVYVKLGLRNAPSVYPSGGHLDSTMINLGIERVRRARLALDILARGGVTDYPSQPGAEGLAIPVPRSQP